MRILVGFCLVASLGFAQFTRGITVTVSKTVTVPISRARFSVSVASPQDIPFSDVLKLLEPLGISVENLSQFTNPRELGYDSNNQLVIGASSNFEFERPSANLEAAFVELTKVQEQIRVATQGRVTIRWELLEQVPTDEDVESARRVALPELWQNAKAQAEEIAAITGKPLENVASIFQYLRGVGSSFEGTIGSTTRLQKTFELSVEFSNIASPGEDGITLFASEIPAQRPVSFTIKLSLEAPLGTTAEQAARRFSSLGIGLSNLTAASVYSPTSGAPPSVALFRFSANHPLRSLNEILARVEESRRQAEADRMKLSYTLYSLKTVAEASSPAARRSALLETITAARSQADQLARLAGGTAGDLLGIDYFGSSYVGSPVEQLLLPIRFALVRRQ